MPSETARPSIVTSGTALQRHIRQVHLYLILSMLALPIVTWMMRKDRTPSPPTMTHGLLVVSGAAALIAIGFQLRMVNPTVSRLRVEGDRSDLLVRLRKGHIYAMASAEVVAMFGVELYLNGASLPQSILVWAVGLALGIMFWPRKWAG
jgi:hypothetical protein